MNNSMLLISLLTLNTTIIGVISVPWPTKYPTPSPTISPTDGPTNSPSPSPTPGPTPAPSDSPTPSPSPSPTPAPSNSPTPSPTNPTISPTPAPSGSPTRSPTPAPSDSPTPSPTNKPTLSPTLHITEDIVIISIEDDDTSSSYTSEDNNFGMALSISDTENNLLIIGAPYEDTIDGDDTISNTGGVYIFEFNFDDGSYTQKDRLSLDVNDAISRNYFGASVGLSGDYAIIGGVGYDGNKGAAYVFERSDNNDNSEWTQMQRLTGSDSDSYDEFGDSVAISGNYAIIGAYGNDNDNGNDAGAVYIFELNEETNQWEQVIKLIENNGDDEDYFGKSVSISGDYAVIGSEGYNSRSIGAAYVYKRDSNGEWNYETRLEASDGDYYDYFGRSVSISGDYIIVGAIGYDVLNSNNEEESNAGGAYIFERDSNTDSWTQVAILTAHDFDSAEYFGYSVSISSNENGDGVAIVGARNNDKQGAGYVFERDNSNNNDGTWIQTKKLIASDASSSDNFGWSVGINEDLSVVGTFSTDTVYAYQL